MPWQAIFLQIKYQFCVRIKFYTGVYERQIDKNELNIVSHLIN